MCNMFDNSGVLTLCILNLLRTQCTNPFGRDCSSREKTNVKPNKNKRIWGHPKIMMRQHLQYPNYQNKSNKELAYVTQTTLSVDDTKDIIAELKRKFPEIKEPKKDDICYATTNRQSAVKKIASFCDMFFIIGSRNSSN